MTKAKILLGNEEKFAIMKYPDMLQILFSIVLNRGMKSLSTAYRRSLPVVILQGFRVRKYLCIRIERIDYKQDEV